MIECYLDESGIHDDASICVIAGYFGGQGQWRKFGVLWQGILKDAKIPLGEFHAKDFVKSKARQATLEALAGVVTSSERVHPVSVGVVVSDFKSLSENQRRFLTGAQVKNGELISTGSPNKPYFFPFLHCVERVAGYASAGGTVDFFCGLDRHFAKYATEVFKSVGSDPRLGDIRFPLARESPQLQAADLLVHLTYLDMQQRILGGNWDQPPSGLLSRCIRNARAPKDDFVYFNGPSMELTVAAANSI